MHWIMERPAKRKYTLPRALPYLLIITGLIGFIASFALTYDKVHLLQDPNYHPGCNLNPIVSCGSVMKTSQASLLGVPNTIFGLVSFSAQITLGVVLLAGAQLKRWFWLCVEAVAIAGLIFVHYLLFEGVFRIHAICPWCFLVWTSTVPTVWYVTLFNLRQGNLRPPKSFQKLSRFAQRNHANILVSWYAALFLLLLGHFWYYWKTLI
jgi:uncharacterized membrane protein